MINLDRKLVDLKGNEVAFSFPRNEEEKAQKETVRNVLLNALSVYPVRNRKEIFFINNLAHKVLESKGELKATEKEKELLADVVVAATFQQDDKGATKGVYLPSVIAQVLEEIGIKE